MATVIIFGLDISGGITLSAFGPTGSNLPPMLVFADGSAKEVPYDPSRQRWETFLKSGKYVVRIEELVNPLTSKPVPVEGAVVALVEAGDASSKALFVSLGKPSVEPRPLLAWPTTAAGGDPKDPWPPPIDSAVACNDETFKKMIAAQTNVVARHREA